MSTYGWQTKDVEDVVTRPMGNGNAQSSIPTVGFPAIWINLVNDPISIVLQMSQISKRVQQRAMSEYRGRLFLNVFK